MRIRINQGYRRVKNFRRTWIKTLENLGLLSYNPEIDCRVIGEVVENSSEIYLDCPDLPHEVLEILKEYYGVKNVEYENT